MADFFEDRQRDPDRQLTNAELLQALDEYEAGLVEVRRVIIKHRWDDTLGVLDRREAGYISRGFVYAPKITDSPETEEHDPE